MHLFSLCYLQRVCWQVRPIDDLTRSGCNAATETTEKLSYESLDALLAVLRALEKAVGPDLTPWKVGNRSALSLQYSSVQFAVLTGRH